MYKFEAMTLNIIRLVRKTWFWWNWKQKGYLEIQLRALPWRYEIWLLCLMRHLSGHFCHFLKECQNRYFCKLRGWKMRLSISIFTILMFVANKSGKIVTLVFVLTRVYIKGIYKQTRVYIKGIYKHVSARQTFKDKDFFNNGHLFHLYIKDKVWSKEVATKEKPLKHTRVYRKSNLSIYIIVIIYILVYNIYLI